MAIELNSGEFRQKVVFKQPAARTKNDEGGLEIGSYTQTILTFAAVRETSSRRVVEQAATALLHSKDFFIRWSVDRDTVDKDWLINYQGNDYVIFERQRINASGQSDESGQFLRFAANVKTDG